MKTKLFLIFLLLITVTGFGQKTDTVKCVMLVSDTVQSQTQMLGHVYKQNYSMNGLPVGGWCFWMKGYEVRERHNTAEESIDPGGVMCIDANGNHVDCYHDYWVHVKYLHTDKKPLLKSIIVWQSISTEKK